MKNYADKMGYSILKTLEAVTFADNAQISSWAKGCGQGDAAGGRFSPARKTNWFDPQGSATRAEGGYCPAPVCGDCH